MTNSPSPGCAAGDCDSDHWSSVAELVDDSLYVIFVEDKDAGGVPQTEGAVTVNPVKYLSYVNPAASGIENGGSLPTTFSLTQNYPNPFNAQTNIEFTLENDSDVEIAVYNITGAKVTTLVNNRMQAGAHTINWDAASVSSGIYYYTLRTNGEELTKKMTLLK